VNNKDNLDIIDEEQLCAVNLDHLIADEYENAKKKAK